MVRGQNLAGGGYMVNINERITKFQRQVGSLLAEIRKKRNLTQNDFSISARTIRRLEKGEITFAGALPYIHELKPCVKDVSRLVKLISTMLEPQCSNCDPDCQINGKKYAEITNLILRLASLPVDFKQPVA